MKTYRFLSLPLLMLMLTAGAFAQPYDRLPAPGDTPPPPMPPTVPPAFNFGLSPSSPTPTLWLWGGYDGTVPTARKFIQPSIGLELYGSNRASKGRTEWGIAEFPMQFSSFADPQDAVLMAEEGEDLIFTVRHNFLNYPCGHAGNNPYAHPTSHGALRFGTKHHVCLPPDPLNPNLNDLSSPEYQLFQHDLERMTIQSNGMVGIHVPEPQRTLHVSNRWRHEAAIRISNDQYSNPYNHLNQHVATLGIAELAVPSAGGLFSTLADANDFVIRTAGGDGDPDSDIILTTHNAGAQIRFATTEVTGQEFERMTIFDNGNVGIGMTQAPYAKLAVNGTICAEEVKVLLTTTSDAACWPDYVFDDEYQLMPIPALEQWVKTHKHLPDVPSQIDVEKNGVDLGAMQAQLLRKVEELTLYIIEQNKTIIEQNKRIEDLEQSSERF